MGLLTINNMKNIEVNTEDFAKIIFDAVYEERYLNKEALVAKIRTLARLYRLKLSSDNFNAIENPTKTANLMQTVKKVEYERKYWLKELKYRCPDDELNALFNHLDKELIDLGFKKSK